MTDIANGLESNDPKVFCAALLNVQSTKPVAEADNAWGVCLKASAEEIKTLRAVCQHESKDVTYFDGIRLSPYHQCLREKGGVVSAR